MIKQISRFSFSSYLYDSLLTFFLLLSFSSINKYASSAAITANWSISSRVTIAAFYLDSASLSLINKLAELTRSFLQPWVTVLCSSDSTVFFIINKPAELIAISVGVNSYLCLRNYGYSRVFLYLYVLLAFHDKSSYTGIHLKRKSGGGELENKKINE